MNNIDKAYSSVITSRSTQNIFVFVRVAAGEVRKMTHMMAPIRCVSKTVSSVRVTSLLMIDVDLSVLARRKVIINVRVRIPSVQAVKPIQVMEVIWETVPTGLYRNVKIGSNGSLAQRRAVTARLEWADQ